MGPRNESSDPTAGGDDDITWMPMGDMEQVGKIAYAFINVDGQTDNPTP